MERKEILNLWRKIYKGELNVGVEEFNKIRGEVVKILEEDFEKIKKELEKMGIEYKGYIEVDGGDVYLVLKIGELEIYYDGVYGEIYKNDEFFNSFKNIEGLIEFLKNLK